MSNILHSTLYKLSSADINTEAEVETRLLAKIFADLGYPDKKIIPKHKVPSLKITDGTSSTMKEVDFLLCDKQGIARVVVEAKKPTETIDDAWGQAASYALSHNKNKKEIKWLLISNGYLTSLFKHDSGTPVVTLQLSDFASGSPPYVVLRSYLKYNQPSPTSKQTDLQFTSILPNELNKLFFKSHDLVWKKEKLNPTDAFFEFCKFIFIKIRQDKVRENLPSSTESYTIPMTLKWLEAQEKTSPHPVRDILFRELHSELETAIQKEKKKRIFETDENLKLGASTCKELIEIFENVNLSSIDEDLNGRMFEVFLAAAIRGRALGQYFTPRPVVDFMTRIALRNADIKNPPKVIDACSGTAGFLIEVMAYLLAGLREDMRFTDVEKEKIKEKICNKLLYGIEANERVARIARINMYLHGDGGSHIFCGDGLDNSPEQSADMTPERKDEVKDHRKKVKREKFDLVLSNPPFSMHYKSSNQEEKRILEQRKLSACSSSMKSNLLFLHRYHELMKKGAEMLIVLDDTILNGKSYENDRQWILNEFIVLSIHSLPFNAFFKAKANIKTSILHLKKKAAANEAQTSIFMSISNNVGHDNSLNDTPNRNNLNSIFNIYTEWQRTGVISTVVRENQDADENLECPEQAWLVPPEELTIERFDAFFYSPDLKNVYEEIKKREKAGDIEVVPARTLPLVSKISIKDKKLYSKSQKHFRYIEISDVTKFGLITKHISGAFDELPSRGQYLIHEGDILLALNNSSRGTVVKVPKQYDGAICTSGFLVVRPVNDDHANLLWFSLRSDFCKKQLYYLAQTASQPELKLSAWKDYFQIPVPTGKHKKKALKDTKLFFSHMDALSEAEQFKLV